MKFDQICLKELKMAGVVLLRNLLDGGPECVCSNVREITLLSPPGKVSARVLLR